MEDDRIAAIRKMPKEQVFLQLLKKERGYYEVILELSKEEALLLSQGNAGSTLMSVMKRKQILLTCVDEIDCALKPLKSWWIEKKDRSSPKAKEVTQELLDLDLILQAILKLDQTNQATLKKIMLTLKEKERSLPSPAQ